MSPPRSTSSAAMRPGSAAAGSGPNAGREEFAVLTYDPAARRLDGRIEPAGRSADRPRPRRARHAVAHLRFRPRQPHHRRPIPAGPARRHELRPALGLARRRARRAAALSGPRRPALRARGDGIRAGARCASRRAARPSATAAARSGSTPPRAISSRPSWGIPNHSEHRDFRLLLTGVSDGGAAEWRRLLSAHFENCPASD